MLIIFGPEGGGKKDRDGEGGGDRNIEGERETERQRDREEGEDGISKQRKQNLIMVVG